MILVSRFSCGVELVLSCWSLSCGFSMDWSNIFFVGSPNLMNNLGDSVIKKKETWELIREKLNNTGGEYGKLGPDDFVLPCFSRLVGTNIYSKKGMSYACKCLLFCLGMYAN
jgi:hypothetical protein